MDTRASRTCAGVDVGCDCRYNAAAPATCGADIEVPLIVLEPLPSHHEVMPTPGARMSTHAPKLEKPANESPLSVAPTVMALGALAGE